MPKQLPCLLLAALAACASVPKAPLDPAPCVTQSMELTRGFTRGPDTRTEAGDLTILSWFTTTPTERRVDTYTLEKVFLGNRPHCIRRLSTTYVKRETAH